MCAKNHLHATHQVYNNVLSPTAFGTLALVSKLRCSLMFVSARIAKLSLDLVSTRRTFNSSRAVTPRLRSHNETSKLAVIFLIRQMQTVARIVLRSEETTTSRSQSTTPAARITRGSSTRRNSVTTEGTKTDLLTALWLVFNFLFAQAPPLQLKD